MSGITQSAIRNRHQELAAIILSFVAMLIVSWRRWTSPIADSGREMDLPLRLLRGEMLYSDINYLYPPFSPYFNSQLYRIFGAHLEVLLASGIFCSALIVALCYRIARRLLSPAEATIAAMAVVVLCLFKPTGNLIWPYSFAALYGMVFALAALLMTLRYSVPDHQSRASLLSAGVFIGLAAITKQEFAIAAAATVTAALVYLYRESPGKLLTELSHVAIPAVIITVPVYALLFYLVGWRTLVIDCHLFYTHLPPSLVFYNAHRTGLDHPLFSFVQMLGAAGVGVAAMSAIALLSDRTRGILQRASIGLITSLTVVVAIKLIAGKHWDGSPVRAMPLLLLAFIIFEWRRRESGSENRSECAALFIISVYSLAILARVSLRVPSGGAFGGYFLPTSLILFCYLFLRALPDAIGRWTSDRLSAKRSRMIGVGLLLVLLLAMAIVFGVRYRKNFDYEITARRGRFFAPRSSGQAISEALDFIEKETRPDEVIAVLPEGSDLPFLAGRRMPLRHQILIPGLMSERDEREAIAKLEDDQVRYVLIVNRPMREFGAEAFGRDFYQTLNAWIEEHYQLVKICGTVDDPQIQIGAPQFFIKILQRR